MPILRRIGAGIVGGERAASIGLHSCRIAWVFTMAMLAIWSWYGRLSTGGVPPQLVICSLSKAAFWIAYLYYCRRMPD